MRKSDQRRYKRISLNLDARVAVNAGTPVESRLVNISPGDLAIMTSADAIIGDAAVVQISGLDVIEGTVARVLPDGFAVSFLLSKKRRAILTEKLMLMSNPSVADGLADRRSEPRHTMPASRSACRLEDGTSLFVRVIDQSVSGVSVEARRRPAVGSSIHIGRERGIVARHTPRGFVVVYDRGNTEAVKQPTLRAV